MSTPCYTTMSVVEHTDMLSDAIQKYQREKVAKKIRKRKENGWEAVHREMKTVAQNIELSEAIQNGFPYCQRRERLVQVLYHKKQDLFSGIPALEVCTMTGYCYPCFVEGIQHRAIYPGRYPPEISIIECTRNLHNYAYYVDLTEDNFLKNKTPDEVPESEWAALEKIVPEHEKGEPMIFIRP